ncbi:hypothetical protein [Bradyrhizobium australafricanum]|uniref:hypothetical protein n=1 Tax=Bradyrhizobium australafricanum TaxID=2821406 RepID=UPI001CE2E8D4|nr:hypothetical protein [Bradyrhizobium australafricanum]MCA6105111.1 hypothetical protein [Bradyrhizobium australafricanum]
MNKLRVVSSRVEANAAPMSVASYANAAARPRRTIWHFEAKKPATNEVALAPSIVAAYEPPPDRIAYKAGGPDELLLRMLGQEGNQVASENMSQLVTPVKIIGALTAMITAMLPIGGVFIGVIYSNIRSDLDDLKKSNIEIVKTVASVDKQAAVTNQKLDDIVRELQKRR